MTPLRARRRATPLRLRLGRRAALLWSHLFAAGRHPAASCALALRLGDDNITARDDNEQDVKKNEN